MNMLISKGRKPKFELALKIIDMNNVPLVSGSSYVKWHLPSSTSAEHRGQTNKGPIREHKVVWDYSKNLVVRMSIDKSNMLQECLINFEVVQDYNYGGRGEKIILGHISLNLAEYVESHDEGDDDGITRRYLMQNSKINSTLKIGISMIQVDGERNFIAPPLKTAAVFGSIAGLMGGQEGEGDELGNMPTIHRTREAGELQDMYRRTISAYWAAQAGELPADKCIENIFAGGTGWASKGKQDKIPEPREHRSPGDQESHFSEYERWVDKRFHHHRKDSGSSSTSRTSRNTVPGKPAGTGLGHKQTKSNSQVDLRALMNDASTDLVLRPGSSDDPDGGRTANLRHVREINEFDLREDLTSWQLPTTTTTV